MDMISMYGEWMAISQSMEGGMAIKRIEPKKVNWSILNEDVRFGRVTPNRVSKQTKQRKRAKEDGMHRTNQRKKELASKSDQPKEIMASSCIGRWHLGLSRAAVLHEKERYHSVRVSLTIEAVNPMCSRSCDIRHYALQMQMASEAKSCESILSCHVKVMWVCRQCRILKYWCL